MTAEVAGAELGEESDHRASLHRPAHFNDAAVLQHDAVVAPRRRLLGVRRHDHGRAELALKVHQQVEDDPAGMGVEVAGRLVGQHQLRAMDDRPRQRHALLLAAGQLVGIAVRLVGDPEPIEQPIDLLAPPLVSCRSSTHGTATLSNTVRLGSRWNDWNTNPSRRRRNRARSASERVARSVPPTMTEPAVGRSTAPEQIQQRALARPAAAEERDRPAARNAKRNFVQRRDGIGALSIRLAGVAHDDEAHVAIRFPALWGLLLFRPDSAHSRKHSDQI